MKLKIFDLSQLGTGLCGTPCTPALFEHDDSGGSQVAILLEQDADCSEESRRKAARQRAEDAFANLTGRNAAIGATVR
jgi:hypothetical protein